MACNGGPQALPTTYLTHKGSFRPRHKHLTNVGYCWQLFYYLNLKRFTNADIIKGDITNNEVLNQYAYANGNPISNIDPFGLFSWSKLGEGVISLVGGIAETAGGVAEATAAAAPTLGVGSIPGALIAANGVCDTWSGICQIRNAFVDDPQNEVHDENWIKTGFKAGAGAIGNALSGNDGKEVGTYLGAGIYNAACLFDSVKSIKDEVKSISYVISRFKNGNILTENGNILSDLLNNSSISPTERYLLTSNALHMMEDIDSPLKTGLTLAGIPSDIMNYISQTGALGRFTDKFKPEKIQDFDLSKLDNGGNKNEEQYGSRK